MNKKNNKAKIEIKTVNQIKKGEGVIATVTKNEIKPKKK